MSATAPNNVEEGLLVDPAEVETLWNFPGLDKPTPVSIIYILARQCAARIESFVGRTLTARDLVEYYQGTGDPFLVLRNYPVNSLTAVYEDMGAAGGQADGAFAAATQLVQGRDFELMKDGSGGAASSGMLRRINNVWQRPFGYSPGIITAIPIEPGCTIKVSYNAGFTEIPADLQQACMLLMAAVKRSMARGEPVTSEGWEDYNYSVAQTAADAIGGLPPATLGILARYRSVAVG